MGLLAALANSSCETNESAAPEEQPPALTAALPQSSLQTEASSSGIAAEAMSGIPEVPASSTTHEASSGSSAQPVASTPVSASVSADASAQPVASTPVSVSASADANAGDPNHAAGGTPDQQAEPGSDSGRELPRQDAAVSDPEYPALPDTLTLHVIGDSTAATFPESDPTHRVGWASVLQRYFVASVTVDNGALSGRSSKSFMDEGHWANMKPTLRVGDYVFIQFGHNDEKSEDPTRYTDPRTTYRANLETYIDDSREAGAVPVLLTSISRRKFDGQSIVATHGEYPAAVIAVGLQTNTPVIDLTEKTRVLLEDLGDAASVSLFADGDNTHLSATGALEVSALFVDGIVDLQLPLAQRLVR